MLLGVVLGPCLCLADGAFPDSMGVLLPTDQPHRIIVTTNFGLIASENDGQSWDYTCEEGLLGPNAFLYQLGPSPLNRIYAVSPYGLSSSTDGCTWRVISSVAINLSFLDVFPDPTDADHVLAAGRPRTSGPTGLYESRDASRTFGPPIFVAPTGALLSGVEISRSNPATIYLTMYYAVPTPRPFLVRSFDRGQTWETLDLSASLGAVIVNLAAVDPVFPRRVFLRIIDTINSRDLLGITEDGGDTVTTPLILPTSMSGFLRRANGTILVAHRQGGFLSTDSGATFTPWLPGVALRGLGERGNVLFIVGDNVTSGFGLATSEDEGVTRRTLLRFSEICEIKDCGNIPRACASAWQSVRSSFQIPANACVPITDGGTNPPDSGTTDGGSSEAGDRIEALKRRCGCAATPAEGCIAIATLVALAARKGRR